MKKDDPDLLAELSLEAISKRAVIAVVWKATSILVRVVVNSCSRRCHLVIRRDHVLDKLFSFVILEVGILDGSCYAPCN